MEQAIELLGLTGLLLAVVASTLAVVVSGFTIFHLIRRAIGRQIDSHTAKSNAEMSETLARIDENVKNLSGQVNALTDQVNAQSGQMQQMERNLRGEITQQGKEIREEMAQHVKSLREEMAQHVKSLREEMAQHVKSLREEMVQQDKSLRGEMAQQDKSLRGEMAQQESRLGDQLKDIRAGMRLLEAKIDKTAADVHWLRGVWEGLGREPMPRFDTRRSHSDSQEHGDEASP